MIVHSEDNGEVKIKITNDGGFFMFCPECGGVWQTSLNVVHKPREVRPINYGGTGINLDMGSSEKAAPRKSPDGKVSIAKELFPEAYE